MKKITFYLALMIAQALPQVVFAQRDPSKEILVFFKEGVEREIRYEKGVTTAKSLVRKGSLKASLASIGIGELNLEAANPGFVEADTLKVLQDGTKLKQLNMAKLFRIKVSEGTSRQEMVEKLKKLPEVLYAEPNGKVTHMSIPSDTRFGEQWALHNTAFPGRDIHAEAAWDIYTGNSNAIIAIIDGGTDAAHADLSAKISGGDSGWGWDGHGVHVSGIAAASSNNGMGISGVDWNAHIHAQRIDNAGDDVDTYNAIIGAVNFSPNVQVLNHSWSLTDEYQRVGRYSTTVSQAFAYAYKANRISVVAMGNHQGSQPNVISYPAGFANVIAIGSTDNQDRVAASSAHGNHIDVSAPGVNILSSLPNGQYGYLSGTSMATPHVSGIASLLKGYRPTLSNDDIENIIRLSADPVEGMQEQTFHPAYGTGRVNADRALRLVRDNPLRQWSTMGGQSVSSTGYIQMAIIGAQGLAAAHYFVKRHEVRQTVTFPQAFLEVIGAWGRGIGSTGWHAGNPNFGEPFCEIVPGTLTNTGATFRTYVYEVTSLLGWGLGWYPASPNNVTFAYTVVGALAPTISGPITVCSSGVAFSVSNLPQGASVAWMAGAGLAPATGVGNVFNVVAISNKHSAQITARIYFANDSIDITKEVTVGIPRPEIIFPQTFCAGQMHNFPYEQLPASYIHYEWSSIPSGIDFFPDTDAVSMRFLIKGTFSINCNAINACGAKSYEIYEARVQRCGPIDDPILIFAYPNPASSTLHFEVDVAKQAGVSSQKNTTQQQTAKSIGTCEVQLVAVQTGTLVFKQTVQNFDTSFDLNVSSVPNGLYILRLVKGGETIHTQTILVQH